MAQSNSFSVEPTQALSADRLATALTHAFSPFNLPDNLTTGDADFPIDEAVLRIVPPPAHLDFDQLEHEVSRQRRIVVRGQPGIPLAAVISIGGALLIHGLLVGGFLLCFYLAVNTRDRGGASNIGDLNVGDAGSGGAGYMFLGDGPQGETAAKGPALPEPTIFTPTPATPPIPEKHPLFNPPSPAPPPPQIAMNPITSPLDEPPMIGVPSGADVLGNVHSTKPPAQDVVPPPPVPVGLPIAPPQLPILATPVHRSNDTLQTPAPAGATPRPGSPRASLDDGSGDNDEGTISLLNSNASGDGVGTGKHRGSGIDRGASGGDNEIPSVREAPVFKLGAQYQFHPPKRRVILTVTVLPDGRTGPIEIAQSCGIPDIDNTYKAHVAREYRFRPAYRDGKPFTATIECSQSFGTDDQ